MSFFKKVYTLKYVRKILEIYLKQICDKYNNKKIIIFDFYEVENFITFYQPLIDELIKDSKISLYASSQFIRNRPITDINKLIKSHNQKKIICFPYQICKLMFIADIFISAHLYGQAPKRVDRINISHNMPVKWWRPRKDYLQNFNIWFLTNPEHYFQIKEAIDYYRLNKNDYQLIEIGYPKLDKVMKWKGDKNVVYKNLKLKTSRFTILYAPSWEIGLSLREIGEELINSVIEKNIYNLIVRLHPASLVDKKHKDYHSLTGGRDWHEYLNLIDKKENIYISSIHDYIDVYQISDIMITDMSSAALEFMTLKKPILYYSGKKYFSEISRNLYADLGNNLLSEKDLETNFRVNAGRTPDNIFVSIEDLFERIDNKLNDKNFIHNSPSTTLVPYNLGSATEYAMAEIIKILKL